MVQLEKEDPRYPPTDRDQVVEVWVEEEVVKEEEVVSEEEEDRVAEFLEEAFLDLGRAEDTVVNGFSVTFVDLTLLNISRI